MTERDTAASEVANGGADEPAAGSTSTRQYAVELAEAGDPRTAPARLHRLTRSRSREVRRAVAANPNTSVADLDTLARRFPVEFAANPLIDWLTLTDAEWPTELSEVSRHRVLASTRSVSLLWWAVNAGDDDDQRAAATNPCCPFDIVRSLATSTDESVVTAAALHVANEPVLTADLTWVRSSTSPLALEGDLADLLAGDLLPRWMVDGLGLPSDADARRELSRHPWANALVLRELLGDEDEPTRRLARLNPSTDPEDVERWNRLRADDPSLQAEELELLATTAHGRERCANHPRLTEHARRRCVTDSSWRVRQAAATNPALSAEEAAGLAVDGDRDVRAAVAGNPALPIAAVLGLRMDTDERVREAALARLVRVEPGEALHPGVPPLPPGVAPTLLFDPVSSPLPLDSLYRRGLAHTADLSRLTPREVDLLASDDDVQLRAALAENVTAPNTLLLRLSGDSDPLVRRRVAVIVHDTDTLARLSTDPSIDVQAGAAQNPRLAPWLALRLAESMSDDVRVALATRPHVSDDVLARLLERTVGDPVADIVSRLVRHDADDPLPGDSGSLIASSVVEEVRVLLEQHSWAALIALRSPSCPTAMLSALRSSPNWRVRQAVGAHPNTVDADLRALAIDNDNDVRAAVAANPSVVLDDFACFVNEADEKVRRALVNRPDISVALLCVHLLGDDGIRAAAMEHPRLPSNIRRDLAALRHGEPLGEEVLLRFLNTSARLLVVAHPSTSGAMLSTVVDDPSWTIREAVAHHPNCSPDDLRRLAEDQDRDVRAAVGANVSTPREVLAGLAGDSDPRVRRSVLGNQTWVSVDQGQRSNSLAKSLLRDESSIVRVVGLLSSEHNEMVLRRPRHVQSIDWLERFAVAVHPNTPPEVREALAADANVVVRAGARRELTWPSQ